MLPIFLVLLFISPATCQVSALVGTLLESGRSTLKSQQTFEFAHVIKDWMNLTVISKNQSIFAPEIYNHSRGSHRYRGLRANYIGSVSYFKLESLAPGDNTINLGKPDDLIAIIVSALLPGTHR